MGGSGAKGATWALMMGCYKEWQDKGLLHKNNYGFKPSMSTDMALRIKTGRRPRRRC